MRSQNLIIFIFSVLSVSLGCSESEYRTNYESAESAYFSNDIVRAEVELLRFEKYLLEKVDVESASNPLHILRSLILTNIRLYEINQFKDSIQQANIHLDKAIKFNELARSDDINFRSIDESDVKTLIDSVQCDERYVPGWKIEGSHSQDHAKP